MADRFTNPSTFFSNARLPASSLSAEDPFPPSPASACGIALHPECRSSVGSFRNSVLQDQQHKKRPFVRNYCSVPKVPHLLPSSLHSFPNLLSRVHLPANTHQNPPISILSLRKGLLQKGAIRTLPLRLSTRRGRQLRDVSGAKRVRWTSLQGRDHPRGGHSTHGEEKGKWPEAEAVTDMAE